MAGISNNNLNNKNLFTAKNLNLAKAESNAGKIAEAKTSKAASAGNSLNSETLKSNQGTIFDSNSIFDKMGDVVPANDNPPVAKAKGKKKDKDKDSGDKKSLGDCIADAQKKAEKLYGQSVTSSTDPNQGNATQVVLVGIVWGIVDYLKQ